MTATIINCKKIKEQILEEVKAKVQPGYKLTCITNPNDAASELYLKNKRQACESVGIQFEEVPIIGNSFERDSARVFMTINTELNPILIQLPFNNIYGDKLTEESLLKYITPMRDVDGFGPGALVNPCTAEGVLKILDSLPIELEGQHVVLVGRSKLCNKPLINMLLDRNATVTVTHSKTKNLKKITKTADILIVAVGKAKFIDKKYVKEGAVVIDVGINKDKEGKTCGDVDFNSVKEIAGYITKVPGGVGQLTVACLIENVVKLYEKTK